MDVILHRTREGAQARTVASRVRITRGKGVVMAHRRKVIAWSLGLGLLLGVAGSSRSEEPDKPQTISIEADHEPLLAVIKRICASQGLGFVANDAALDKAGKVSLRLHEV